METKESLDSVKRMDYKDIQLEYARYGLAKVQSAVAEGKASFASVKRAADIIQATSGIDGSDLVAWVASVKGKGKGRGRGQMQPGDVRNYKVQSVDGSSFLRLPTPNVEGGFKLPVELSEDGSYYKVYLSRAFKPEIKVIK